MTLLTRGSRWPSCFIHWCYTPAVWREWNFQVRSLQKQSLWQNQNKFCRAWKCRRTSLVSCSWPQPLLPGPAAFLTCSKAPLAASHLSTWGEPECCFQSAGTESQLPELQPAGRERQESYRGSLRGGELVGSVGGHSFSAIHFKDERAWKAPAGAVVEAAP